MTRYVVLYEQAEDGGWGAYLPDLPGVVAGGETREEVERLIQEALVFYAEIEQERGSAMPAPTHQAGFVNV